MRRISYSRLVAALAFFTLVVECNSSLQELNEENWKLMLRGEWMVQFVAPWCTSCQIVLPVWERFAKSAGKYNLKVAQIDITKSPSLSGRFLVSSLPTVYHVIDGKFRYYTGQRDIDALIDYIKLKEWKSVEPISAWTDPNSLHMGIMSYFFCLSFMLKEWHGKLQEVYGFSVYSSYALFTLTTILVGAIFGLLLVTALDFVCPSRNKKRRGFEEIKKDTVKEDEKNEQQLVDDEIEDFEQEKDAAVDGGEAISDEDNDDEFVKEQPDKISMNVSYTINKHTDHAKEEDEDEETDSDKETFHTCKLSPITSDLHGNWRKNTTF